MYSSGHTGISFTLYAPLLFILFYFGFFFTGILGAIIVLFLASTPDADMKFQYKSTIFHKIPLVRRLVPNIEHRGITHTIWFMGVIGLILSGIGIYIYPLVGELFVPTRVQFSLFLFLFGALGILFHILGDYITPSGINILYPWGKERVLTIHRSNPFLISFRPRSEVGGTIRENGVLTVAASSRANALAGMIGIVSLAFSVFMFGVIQMEYMKIIEGVLVFSGGYLLLLFLPIFISQWREFVRYVI